MTKEPICLKCRYYHITWDKRFPYGCRALGFKSQRAPFLTVKEASGTQCLYFSPKRKLSDSLDR